MLIKILRFLPTAFIIALLMPVVAVMVTQISQGVGLRSISVQVEGTGSMYPSLFWEKSEGGPEDPSKKLIEEYRTSPHMYRRFVGLNLFGRTFLHRGIGFGDMVAFQNNATATILKDEGKNPEAGFVKRVIGLPGDTIEIRDGFVLRNGTRLDEPYIATARSTYGGTTISDCAPIHVPSGQYLVLGDNRKVSLDSRFELGLVSDADINFVLPFADQSLYRPLWRDTSKDASLAGTPTLDVKVFYSLVNSLRASLQLPPLKPNSALEKSSVLRADGSQSLASSLAAAGYSNIATGEFETHGHYTAEELLQNILAFKNTASQLENKTYQEIGVAAVEKDVNGCPTQIIVGHLGGYVPAAYDDSTLKNWQSLIDNLQSVIPSWESAVGNSRVDQTKLQELLTILRRRLSLAQSILSKMQAKTWLTDADQAAIKADAADAAEADALAKELNRQP